MDITGKITQALEPRSGVSQRSGNPWKSQEFVIEWYENQYPRHCVFRVFGEDRLNQMNLQVGQEYTISFDIDAHEYNGRWFNDINAWRAQPPVTAAAAGQPAPAAVQTPQAAPAAPAAPVAQDAPAEAAPVPNATDVPAGAAGTEDDLPF